MLVEASMMEKHQSLAYEEMQLNQLKQKLTLEKEIGKLMDGGWKDSAVTAKIGRRLEMLLLDRHFSET